jgi:hypothetical protein
MVLNVAAAAFVAATAFVTFEGAASADNAARPISGTAHGGLTGFTGAGELVFDYTGRASHLGNYTRHEVVAIDGGGNLTGTIVFIAANGDELDASFTGHFTSPVDAVGTYTFTGGTGRFADATGTTTFSAHAPDLSDVSVSFNGTIGY